MAQSTPSTSKSFNSDLLSLTVPSLPTPEGIEPNNSLTRVFSWFLTLSTFKLDLSNLTPQLISYPTPPGLITPSSKSVAATPPTGNPYPSCPSGNTTICFLTPGKVETFTA